MDKHHFFRSSLSNFYEILWLEFYHLYVLLFKFNSLTNKKGIASLRQYLCNLTNYLNTSHDRCLLICLNKSIQWLSFDFSKQKYLCPCGFLEAEIHPFQNLFRQNNKATKIDLTDLNSFIEYSVKTDWEKL